jgi:hypothetical protein
MGFYESVGRGIGRSDRDFFVGIVGSFGARVE